MKYICGIKQKKINETERSIYHFSQKLSQQVDNKMFSWIIL